MRPKRAKTPKRDEDSALIEAINAGQHERFQELVQRYEQRLYNFSLRVCGDAQDAEDIVQDTFLNVFRYLKTFRFETKFKNWLYRIAISACLKRRRKSKYAPDKEISLEELISPNQAGIAHQIPSWASMPLENLLNAELSAMLNKAIQELPPKYRMVMILRDVEGFSTQETAQIMKVTPANVKVRLHRARLFMREALKRYFDHGV